MSWPRAWGVLRPPGAWVPSFPEGGSLGDQMTAGLRYRRPFDCVRSSQVTIFRRSKNSHLTRSLDYFYFQNKSQLFKKTIFRQSKNSQLTSQVTIFRPSENSQLTSQMTFGKIVKWSRPTCELTPWSGLASAPRGLCSFCRRGWGRDRFWAPRDLVLAEFRLVLEISSLEYWVGVRVSF